jgi:hypothetical protein
MVNVDDDFRAIKVIRACREVKVNLWGRDGPPENESMDVAYCPQKNLQKTFLSTGILYCPPVDIGVRGGFD